MNDKYCKICEEEYIDEYEMYDKNICSEGCYNQKERKQEIKEFEDLMDNHSYSQEDNLQSIAHGLHTESNCNCDVDADTFTLESEGAGDIEMCLYCYDARGCVY